MYLCELDAMWAHHSMMLATKTEQVLYKVAYDKEGCIETTYKLDSYFMMFMGNEL